MSSPVSAENLSLEAQQNEALELGQHFARELMATLVQIRYAETSPNVIFWASFFASLHGYCARIVGKDNTDAVFTMMQQIVQNTPLGETKHERTPNSAHIGTA